MNNIKVEILSLWRKQYDCKSIEKIRKAYAELTEKIASEVGSETIEVDVHLGKKI